MFWDLFFITKLCLLLLWQLLRLLTVFNLQGTSPHIVDMCVERLHVRREPDPIVLLSVLDDIVLMVVRQQPVHFADFVVLQFQLVPSNQPLTHFITDYGEKRAIRETS
jgi:hypothetical protein